MKTNVIPKRMTAHLYTGANSPVDSPHSGVSLWTIAMCMTSAWILLSHYTLIQHQFNGIVVVQRYFIVVANNVYFCYKIRN